MMKITEAKIGDSIFHVIKKDLENITSLARDKIAKDLDLIDENLLHFVGLLTIQCMKKMNKLIKLSLVTIHFQCLKEILKILILISH